MEYIKKLENYLIGNNGYLKRDISKRKVVLISGVLNINSDWMINTIKKDILFYPTDYYGILKIKKIEILYPNYYNLKKGIILKQR